SSTWAPATVSPGSTASPLMTATRRCSETSVDCSTQGLDAPPVLRGPDIAVRSVGSGNCCAVAVAAKATNRIRAILDTDHPRLASQRVDDDGDVAGRVLRHLDVHGLPEEAQADPLQGLEVAQGVEVAAAH